MIKDRYNRVYKEVIEIISHLPKEEYDRIPKEKIDYYKENMDKDYKFTINPEIDLAEQNISKEASAIIVTIFRDYFATEVQKKKLEELIKLSEKKSEIEKRRKYNPDEIFNDKEKEENKIVVENNLPIEVKKYNFLRKLIDYIKNLFVKK